MNNQRIKNQQEYLMNDGKIVRVWMISGSFIYVLIEDRTIGSFKMYDPDQWLLKDFITMVKMGTLQLIKDSKTRKGAIDI